jgi:hypothetical protein
MNLPLNLAIVQKKRKYDFEAWNIREKSGKYLISREGLMAW